MNYTPRTENDILDIDEAGYDGDCDNDGSNDNNDQRDPDVNLDTAPSVDNSEELSERNQITDENQDAAVADTDQEDQDEAIVDQITEPDDFNKVLDLDDLLEHIETKKLNLALRRPTSMDGNCLFDSLCDLIEKFDIKSVPREKQLLRQKICDSMIRHPEFPSWMKEIFKRPVPFQMFLQKQKKNGQFSDNMGFMITTAAFLIGKIYFILDRVLIRSSPRNGLSTPKRSACS